MKRQLSILFLYSILFTVLIGACSESAFIEPAPPVNNEPEEMEEMEDMPEPVEPTPEVEVEPENVVWQNWYLSIPINQGNGKASSIFYEDIVNDRLTNRESEYFYKNEDGSYTMWTKFTGYTTSGFSELGDKYCRTELREYWRGNQSTTDNWSMATGVHILESTLHVDFVEGNGRTIIAQIHGKESEGISGNPATVKIRWNSGMIQIDHYTKPNEGDPWTSNYDNKVDFGRVDNEKFTIKLKVEDGIFYCALVCEAKGLDIPYTEMYDYVGNGYIHENYFKTGNYFGWHDDYEKAAQVVLHKVITEHR